MSGAKTSENRKFAYLLPQDEIAIKRETSALAALECLSDLDQHIYLTRPQIEERAIGKCQRVKEISECKEVCNDISSFHSITIQSYIASYTKVQLFFQENPQELEKSLKEIAEFGLERCLQDLLNVIDEQLAQQQGEVS